MTAPSNANTSGLYLLMKRGLYYRPDAMGYTGIKDHAGRYSKDDAEDHADPASGVTMVSEAEAPEFSPNCFDDLARAHLLKQRDAAEARADRLAKALKETRNRVREWPIDDHETCMCGSPVASHGMGDGHSPVSQGDHAISMIVEAINEALQQETQP